MARRRRFGIWDRLSLHAMLKFEHAAPRTVPRLGMRRPLIERLNLWTWKRLGRWRFQIVIVVAFACSFGAVLLSYWLFRQGWIGARVVQLLWLGIIACAMTPLVLFTLTSDPRLLTVSRLRCGLTRRMTARDASHLSHRRAVWLVDLKTHALLLQEGVVGSAMSMLLTLLVPLTIQLARTIMQWTVPDGPALIPAPSHASKYFVTVPFAVTMIGIVYLATLVMVLHQRIKWVFRSVARDTCPECQYPQQPGTIVQDEQGRPVHFGPSACSECGTPWPLIPPRPMSARPNRNPRLF